MEMEVCFVIGFIVKLLDLPRVSTKTKLYYELNIHAGHIRLCGE